ncbi:hypothetical protein PoB_004916400 [Plakobranchus ocellatus]|uniref:Uncharacterized protein n=1 Tax=Plakobranchus ocellatus TaxID=259542 RepID=A0AAV4BV33_9GAST|nr:hypothetical protein PoB_004916400 [Plakobranchus ocellatus]
MFLSWETIESAPCGSGSGVTAAPAVTVEPNPRAADPTVCVAREDKSRLMVLTPLSDVFVLVSLFCSAVLIADLVVACQLPRSAASASKPPGSMSPAFRFRLFESIYIEGLVSLLDWSQWQPHHVECVWALCRHA